MQKVFLHQKRYEVHTLNEDIFCCIFQSVKHLNSILVVLTLMLLSVAVISLYKKLLRCVYFTTVATFL